jgi:serine/threonine protein kinase/TolB-like protein
MLALSVDEIAELSSLLDEAISMDAPARREWIERLSPERRKLATTLRKSLLADTRMDGVSTYLDTLPKFVTDPGQRLRAIWGVEPGVLVGPWRLVRRLGAGGMAEVWLAQRADGAFRRDVALKLPMLSDQRPDLAQRFARECDILAGLEHVNIARMYDAGVAPGGLPYLAMEYVRGEPLITWCDRRGLDAPERIRLFLQVLDAIQYAHRRRVIHRDLKPSNILVTEDGEIRVLDFGVAHFADDADGSEAQLTRQYGRALTPDYASPELLRGECADTRSDIYSLGVVLYELLTRSRPYSMRTGASADRLQQEIGAVRIEPPSARPGSLTRPGRAPARAATSRAPCDELDYIVLRALSQAPRRRYESVGALADELRCHLDGKAVCAATRTAARKPRPDDRRFQLKCALGVLAAVLLVLLVVLQISGRAASPAGDGSMWPLDGVDSIAVLPFAELGAQGEPTWLGNGIAEKVRTLLAGRGTGRDGPQRPPARITDRRTSPGQQTLVPAVSHILEGSVRRSGHRLTISAQLVRADDGDLVWSGTYNRELDDELRLQDEVACVVVDGLRASHLLGNAPEPAGSCPNIHRPPDAGYRMARFT